MLLKQRQVPERSSGTSLIHQVRNHDVGSNPTLPTKWFPRPTGQDIALLKREYGFESRGDYKYSSIAQRQSKRLLIVRSQVRILVGEQKCRSGGMVDTLALGASTRKGVWVRVPPSVQIDGCPERRKDLAVNQTTLKSTVGSSPTSSARQSCSSIGGAPLLHSGGSRIVTDRDYKIGIQLNWLEHSPDTRKVVGSSPTIPTNGTVAEWCRKTRGTGLQNLSHWFEPSQYLKRFLSINGDALVL